jgi:uncharacterized damage-inducible protein DinB
LSVAGAVSSENQNVSAETPQAGRPRTRASAPLHQSLATCLKPPFGMMAKGARSDYPELPARSGSSASIRCRYYFRPTDQTAEEAMTDHTPVQVFLDVFERECQTTIRVLRAYPEDKADLRPHPKSKSARELAFIFALEQGLMLGVLGDKLDFSGKPPEAPPTIAACIDAFEDGRRKVVAAVNALSEEKLSGTVKFMVAPKQMGDIPTMDFLWYILFDQIHHRGQFSVYLRMADAKVPSIYGPTADEPWR